MSGPIALGLLVVALAMPAGPASAETVASAVIGSTSAAVVLNDAEGLSHDTAPVEVTYSCTNDGANTYYLQAELSQETGPSYVYGDPTVPPGWAPAICTGESTTQTLELVRAVSGNDDPRVSQTGDATLDVSLHPQSNAEGQPTTAPAAAIRATVQLTIPVVVTTPQVPAAVTSTVTTTTATLHWEEPTHTGGAPVTGYRLSRTGFTTLLPTEARSYTSAGLAPGHSYILSLQAVNSAGVGAAVSITVTTLPAPPSAPVSLSVVPGSTTAVLRWAAPTNTGGAAVTGYQLSRTGFAVNLPATARTYTFSGLRPATAYTLYVQGRNSAGLGTTARIQLTTPAARPSAPVSVRVTPQSTSVLLSWSAPTSNGGAPLTGYRLSRSGFERTVSATARTYTFTGLRAGTSYNLYVQATNRVGLGTAARVTVTTSPAPRAYRNCTALNAVYRHGVGRSGAVDRTSGTRVTSFFVSNQVYAMNDGRDAARGQYDLDRDNDGIACEKR